VLVILSIVHGRSALLAVILLVLSSTGARAADADAAAQAYQHALSLYSSGDIVGALASMRESYRLSARSELLYNLARLEDEAGDCARSLADYRQYLERVPHGQYRELAAKASSDLDARCPAVEETQRAALTPTVSSSAEAAPSVGVVASSVTETSAPEPESAPPAAAPVITPAVARPKTPRAADAAAKTRRWIGWSAVAAGGLAGVGAIYFTVSALDARSRFRSSMEGEAAGGPYADFGLQDEQHRDQRWARVLAVTGGALLGGGILVLALGSGTPGSAHTTAGVWLSPGHVSAQLSSSF
jgi:hypothetical protein